MENNKNTNKLVLSTIIILAIIIIIIMIVIIFMQRNNYEQRIESLESNIEKLQLENAEKIDNTYKKNLKTSYKETMGEYDSIDIYLDSEERKNALPGIKSVQVDNNGDAYVTIDITKDNLLKYNRKTKVDSDVANIYLCYTGNGGFANIVFLHNDGTVSKMSGMSTQKGEIIVEKIEQLKNIVNVIAVNVSDEFGSGASTYYFIDIDGNIIKNY